MNNNEDDVTTQMSNPNAPPCANYKQFPVGVAIRDGVWQDGVFYPAE
jgi:hypothetical protein